MSKSTVLQMIGRAGRPGYDTSGTAVIMTSTEDRQMYLTLTLDIVESSLPGHLVEGTLLYLLATILTLFSAMC